MAQVALASGADRDLVPLSVLRIYRLPGWLAAGNYLRRSCFHRTHPRHRRTDGLCSGFCRYAHHRQHADLRNLVRIGAVLPANSLNIELLFLYSIDADPKRGIAPSSAL